jgi:glycosyltransferase involved in cell wall biosynthesis
MVSGISPRLLLVAFTPFPAPGGLATRLAQRIVALTRAGFGLDLLTRGAPQLPHMSTLGSARIFRVPSPGLRDSSGSGRPRESASGGGSTDHAAAFERAVRRQLQANEYDAVHAFDTEAAEAILNHRHQAPLIYDTGSDPTGRGPGPLEESTRRHQLLLGSASAVFCRSRRSADQAIAAGVRADRVHVLPPSVELDLFSPSAAVSSESRSLLRVALVKSTLRSADVAFLEAVLRQIPHGCVTIRVRASVPETERRRIAADPRLQGCLIFQEPVLYDDLPPVYRECQIGLVPAAEASRPVHLQPAAEMMACGLASILPDVPEVREVVRPAEDAILVEPGSAPALVKALETLWLDGALRVRLGLAARDCAVRQFDESTVSSALVRVYRSVFARVKLPSGEEHTPAPGEPTQDGLPNVQALMHHALSEPPTATAERARRLMAAPSEEVTLPEGRRPVSVPPPDRS